MQWSLTKTPEDDAALDRVGEWTRARFGLASNAVILAMEIQCAVPGCPPRETVVAFWVEDGSRRHFTIFKPAAAIAEDDLPPKWMKSRLLPIDEWGCECC